MYYQTESNIRAFQAWAGGNAWQKVVLNSSEDVNDFLWFDLPDHMDENGYTYDPISDSFIENEEY